MSDNHPWLYAQVVDQRRQARAKQADAIQVDVLREQPARVVLPESVWRDQSLRFKLESVGAQVSAWL